MIRQILNNESVHVIVFNSENNSIQTIFQAYALSNVSDCYEYQMIEINTIQSIRKYLNEIHLSRKFELQEMLSRLKEKNSVICVNTAYKQKVNKIQLINLEKITDETLNELTN